MGYLYLCYRIHCFRNATLYPVAADKLMHRIIYILCSSRLDAVRLVGGPDIYTGRLEINYNGYWGTVCNDNFGDDDAAVACYMLGFGYVRLTKCWLFFFIFVVSCWQTFAHQDTIALENQTRLIINRISKLSELSAVSIDRRFIESDTINERYTPRRQRLIALCSAIITCHVTHSNVKKKAITAERVATV